MAKALKAVAVMAVVGASALAWSSMRCAPNGSDELNAATDARLHAHLQALIRGQLVEAARKQASSVRVASR